MASDLTDHQRVQGLGTSPPRAAGHLAYIDNLRIVLISAVIFYHASITYGAPGFWPYTEGQPDELTEILMSVVLLVVGAFGLGLFFMLSGYFTPRSLDRKGPATFVNDRLIRLGVPLLFYIVVFDTIILYAISVVVRGFEGSLWEYLPSFFENYGSLGVGPMWFVETLLIFTLLYVLTRRGPRPRRRGEPKKSQMPGDLTLAGFAVALGLVTYVWRIWLPEGSYFRPFGLPLASMPQYLTLFTVGILAYRRNWLLRLSDEQARRWRWIAGGMLVILPVLLIAGGALDGDTDPFLGGTSWQSLARSMWEQLLCVAMVIVIPVWFRGRFDHQGTVARSMSASAYTVYFIHAPVLVLAALAARDIDWHPLLKFAVVGTVAVSLCFVLATLIRKLPGVRSIL